MKTDKPRYKEVCWQNNFPASHTDQYKRDTIYLVGNIYEGEDYKEVGIQAMKDLAELHKIARPEMYELPYTATLIQTINKLNENPPNLYNPIPTHNDETIEQPPKKNYIEQTIEDINACKDLDSLLSFKIIAASNTKMQSAYNLKMKDFVNPELSNNKETVK